LGSRRVPVWSHRPCPARPRDHHHGDRRRRRRLLIWTGDRRWPLAPTPTPDRRQPRRPAAVARADRPRPRNRGRPSVDALERLPGDRRPGLRVDGVPGDQAGADGRGPRARPARLLDVDVGPEYLSSLVTRSDFWIPSGLTPGRSSVVSRAAKLLGCRFQGSLANFLSPARGGLACSRLASRRCLRRAE
jgi:hypothetical protein